ncbi:MAG: PilZ domain-containing protein [Phycisphaerae bacterium]
MDAIEISPLTEEAIIKLLTSRKDRSNRAATNGRRRAARWPFPGTVQLWMPDDSGTDQHYLATCVNLSPHGLGMLSDIELAVGTEVALAVHQPENSFQGRGVIRHCTEIEDGYYVGVQFIFDDSP